MKTISLILCFTFLFMLGCGENSHESGNTRSYQETLGVRDREQCESYCSAAEGVLIEIRGNPNHYEYPQCVCAIDEVDLNEESADLVWD